MKLSYLFFVALLFLAPACTPNQKTSDGYSYDADKLVEDLKVLSSDEMEGRKTGTVGNERARDYLVNRFEEEGAALFEGSYEHKFSFTNRAGKQINGVNVTGQINGKSDSVIVISAHYDHLGIKDNVIYNGADDDASGTAALLAFIDYFNHHTPNHTLVFAAFDAEEMGLRGARAFVEDSVFMQKVVLNVNMDMISQNDKNELYASGTYHNPALKPILESIDTGDINLLFGHDRPEEGYNDWTRSSDHGAFYAKGKRFIYFGVEDHEHYHKESDEFETIPLNFYKKSTEVILKAILAFDKKIGGA
jgi:hypothetical protein